MKTLFTMREYKTIKTEDHMGFVTMVGFESIKRDLFERNNNGEKFYPEDNNGNHAKVTLRIAGDSAINLSGDQMLRPCSSSVQSDSMREMTIMTVMTVSPTKESKRGLDFAGDVASYAGANQGLNLHDMHFSSRANERLISRRAITETTMGVLTNHGSDSIVAADPQQNASNGAKNHRKQTNLKNDNHLTGYIDSSWLTGTEDLGTARRHQRRGTLQGRYRNLISQRQMHRHHFAGA